MPIILSTSNIIINNGITNFTMETVKFDVSTEKDTVGSTSNLTFEPSLDSVSRTYPPARTFTQDKLNYLDGNLIKMVASGLKHTIFLTTDGKVYASGDNTYGQLGTGDTISNNSPILITQTIGSLNITAVACGRNHTLFLTNTGKVYACGSNYSGQLGRGTSSTSITTTTELITPITTLTISAIACGEEHSAFLANNGTVYACGRNIEGQLGRGTTSVTTSVAQVTSVISTFVITAIACGSDHTVFLRSNGLVYACGLNTNGQLGRGDTTASALVAQVTSVISAILIKAIACGQNHTIFLSTTNTVFACGLNDNGQLGRGNTTASALVAQITTGIGSLIISKIAAGTLHSVFLTSDGKVYVCGDNAYGQLGNGNTLGTDSSTAIQVSSLNSQIIRDITCGWYCSIFITNSRQDAYFCGDNSGGQYGQGNTISSLSPTSTLSIGGPLTISAISGGGYSLLFLTNDGKVYSCGRNSFGQLGNSINNGTENANPTPTLITTTTVGGTPTPFNNLTISAIAGRDRHSVFLTNDGKVYVCGRNLYGQLGISTNSATETVNPIPTLITTTTIGGIPTPFNSLIISAVSTGDHHSAFITNYGSVYTCGYNWYGQLGNATNNNTGSPTSSPTLITRTTVGGTTTAFTNLTIIAVSCGENHSVFLTNDGRVYVCGRNTSGQLGINTFAGAVNANPNPTLINTLTSGGTSPPTFDTLIISAISASVHSTYCITNDGKVYCFGLNTGGQLANSTNNGTDVQNYTPTLITATTAGGTPTAFNNLTISNIAGGVHHAAFLTNDGKVYACGYNLYGQLGSSTNSGLNNPNPTPRLITDVTIGAPPTAFNNLTISGVTGGYYSSTFLTNDGKVYSCGYNLFGQLGNSTNSGTATATQIPTLIRTFYTASSFYGSGIYTVSYSTFTTSFEPFRCFNDTSSANNPAIWRAGDYTNGAFNSNLNLVSGYYGDWLVIKLPVSIKLKRFDIQQISTALNRAPKNFRLYGSTNGSSWTPLVDKQNAVYTNLFYVHTDMTQYPSAANQYYNHFGLVVNTLFGPTETTLSFDEFFIYGTEQVSATPLLLNSTNKSLIIPSLHSSSYPNSNLNYNLSFPVPTFVNNISTSSNIVLQGEYTVNILNSSNTQIIPNGGQLSTYSLTLNLPTSNITLNYHLLNPIRDPKGAQWTYSSANHHVYHLGNVGIGTKTPSYSLHVNGDMFVSSMAYTSSGQTTWTIPSDRRIKENIVKASYEKCLDNVNNIELYRFNFKDNVVNTNDYNQLGFIAQEVQNVYPKAVEVNMIKDKNGVIPDLLSLNTTQIDYTLYGAVKELIKKVEKLEKKLEENVNSNMMLSDVPNELEEYSSNIVEPPIYPDDYLMMMLPPHLHAEHIMLNESSSNIKLQPISYEEYLRNLMMIPPHLHKTYEEYLRKLMIYPEVPEVSEVSDVPNKSTSNIIVPNESTSNIRGP